MNSSSQIVYAVRLMPGQDLKTSLVDFAHKHQLKAAYILTCVGSLKKAHLRLANKSQGTQWEQKMEIVSLVGTFSIGGIHLHISLSDSSGQMIGGHLLDGCEVFTTAEIVIGEATGLEFMRTIDPATGHLELNISSKKDE